MDPFGIYLFLITPFFNINFLGPLSLSPLPPRMSFVTATTDIHTRPHIRQKGFAPDDLYTSSNNGFHAKYPSPPLNLPSLDFGDDLAGLMAADANGNENSRSSLPNGYQQQQHLHQDDHYRHNIFDTQIPQVSGASIAFS
jgi:hypothetical protein